MTQSMESFQAKATAAKSCEMRHRLDWLAGPPGDAYEIFFLFLFLQDKKVVTFYLSCKLTRRLNNKDIMRVNLIWTGTEQTK